MTTTHSTWTSADHSHGPAFEPIALLNRWWRAITPRLPFTATSLDAFHAWQAAVRQAVLDQLGFMPPPLPLAPQVQAEGTLEEGITYRYGTVETADGMRVPFLVLLPAGLTQPAPGVLCVHGHGDGMNPLIGLDAQGQPVQDEYQHCFALEACRRGFVALTFDMLCFGRRRDFAFLTQTCAGPCETPTKLALQLGATMLGLRVFDARQMLTLLGQQPEVDAQRLGMAGISGGGTITFFTSVLDDRVRAAMISGYFNQFSAFMQVPHCVDNFVPGLATVAEMPDLGCAIAPRPLLISQGIDDPIFPIAATRAGVVKLREAYRLHRADERVEEEYYPGGHTFSNARAWDFFTAWL